MTLTQLQKEARSGGIGASECAIILGKDGYSTPYDLWLIKTGKVDHEVESEAAEIGNAIEATTANLAEKRLGKKLVKPTATYKAPNGFMFANLDRQIEKAARGADIVECKSTGIVDGWGEPGTDEVPDRVLIQCHAQMFCAGAELAHVARLLGRFGFSFSMFEVPMRRELAEIIEEAVGTFWNDHVLKDIPPEDSLPSLSLISKVKRLPGKSVILNPHLVHDYDAARAAVKAAEEEKEKAQSALLAAMKDAEFGEVSGYSVSYKEVSTTRLDSTALKEARPEIAAEFSKTTTSRRLDVRAKKAGK